MKFRDLPLSEKYKYFFDESYYVEPEDLEYKINADYLIHNCYEESGREMYVSYIPMTPLIYNTVVIEEADYILYEHCYARIKDMSDIVIKQLQEIDQKRKKGAEIIVVGKACNVEPLLNGTIENITFIPSHYTEELGKRFNKNIKEEYFVYDDENDALNIWPVDGCNRNCGFCRRTYMHIPFESIPLDEIKERLDDIRANHPEWLKHVNVRAENLTEYGIDLTGHQDLAKLIDLLSSYDEIETLSFPIGLCIGEITPEILDALCRCPKIDYVSLNIEAGSDRLLKVISKGHTIEDCKHIFSTLKKTHPELYIISNVMIGLPTEEITDMYDLVNLVCDLDIDYLWINHYGMAERQPLAKLPQISPSLRDYHLHLFLENLSKRKDNPLRQIEYPRILDRSKRSINREIEKLKKDQELYDNGLTLAVGKILEPERKKLSKIPTLRF